MAFDQMVDLLEALAVQIQQHLSTCQIVYVNEDKASTGASWEAVKRGGASEQAQDI